MTDRENRTIRKGAAAGVDDLLRNWLTEAARDPDVALIFLQELWPRVVGEEVAGHSRPVQLVGRVLAIEVQDEGWKNQLESLNELILSHVNQMLGKSLVGRVKVRLP